MGKYLKTALFAVGIICIGLSVYYVVQIILHDLWDDTTIRTAQILQFFGGGVFIALSRILKLQEACTRKLTVPIIQLETAKGLPLPSYQTDEAAGMDLFACLPDSSMIIKPMERVVVPCGFKMALPAGYEAQIRPRSGLALKHGISMPNSPGTIDSDYRGEVGVVAINLGNSDFTVNHGDRIAQMVINKVEQIEFKSASQLPDTNRGDRGYGSTGK